VPAQNFRNAEVLHSILFRIEDALAIDKIAGWLVHRSPLDPHETRIVIQAVRNQIGQHVYPVHRLDKGTCGVLLLALNSDAARSLTQSFATQQVRKRYLAFVRGWPPETAFVDHALKPDDAPADAAAQSAQTRFTRLAYFDIPDSADNRFPTTRVALVAAEPLTGRRHQIRRHLKHMAHPIIGDATHGKGPLNRWWAERLGLQRLWLHSQSLAFPHPETGEIVTVESGLRWVPGDSPGAGELVASPEVARLEPVQQWLGLWAHLRAFSVQP
jgi:tRNA pseudouridine65 synthase